MRRRALRRAAYPTINLCLFQWPHLFFFSIQEKTTHIYRYIHDDDDDDDYDLRATYLVFISFRLVS